MTQLSIHSFFAQLHLCTNCYVYKNRLQNKYFSAFLFCMNYWKLIHFSRSYPVEIIKMSIPTKKNFICLCWGSNPGPFACEANVITTTLRKLVINRKEKIMNDWCFNSCNSNKNSLRMKKNCSEIRWSATF